MTTGNALMNTYGDRKLTLVRGEGVYVWDQDGRRYLDALAGIAVCGLGHCPEVLTKAIAEQTQSLIHVSNLYNTEPGQQLAQLLCEQTGMEKVFFSNSGAEANEAAIKIARKYGNDKGIDTPTIITMNGSFHGRTMATLTATGNDKVKQGFTPLVPGFKHVPFNDLESVQAAADESVVAVLVEPIQGEGGIRVPDEDYLNGLYQLCQDNNWLLMLDEIQTGNGRTGKLFAFQHSDAIPDVVTTAKGLGNGLPIGACMARGKAADILQPGNHGSTYGGNPLVCRGALSVIEEIIDRDIPGHVANIGKQLLDGFKADFRDTPEVVDIRGQGLMLGIELDRPCGDLVNLAAEQGLLINVTASNSVRLLPPLIINQEQAQEIRDALVSLIKNFVAGE